MNWSEFKSACEKAMAEKGIDPESVTVRIEVADSYYDEDIVPGSVWLSIYDDGPRLVIFGGSA